MIKKKDDWTSIGIKKKQRSRLRILQGVMNVWTTEEVLEEAITLLEIKKKVNKK